MDVTPQADSTAPDVPSADEIDAISSRRFSTSFRGLNPDEVRVHLVEIAEVVRALTRRYGEMERQLAEAEAAARRADLTRLDPDEVDRVLGDETARVLRTARESAAEMESKAAAQAELLVSQAADDAARIRAEARDEAARIRSDAEETASAVRTAGSAHVDDLRAAAESEISEERAAAEEHLAGERRAMEAEIAALRTAAEEDAAAIREAAQGEAGTIRAEADAYAEQLRGDVGVEVEQLRSTVEGEARALTSQAAIEVADAERLRDRILADLARRRRAARQHLEQLQAGRDRLLTAYEVIRFTSEQATDELAGVLGDAKRAADDAARQVGAEELPTPEEMLAELEAARENDPSMGVPPPTDDDMDDRGDGSAEDDVVGDDAEPVDVAEPVADDAEDGELLAPGPAEATGSDMSEPAVERPAPRRSKRRGKRRDDPLEGESLPDVPMVPVSEAADFEQVRVVAPALVDPADVVDEEPAPAPDAQPSGTPPGRGDVPVAEGDDSGDPTVDGDDAVTDIFARLRAERERAEDAATADEAPSSSPPQRPDRGDGPEPAGPDTPTGEAPEGSDGPAAEREGATAAQPVGSPGSDEADEVAAGDDGARLASLFERRDAAVDDAARRLSKHLKRRLSDQQSALLDQLRQAGGPVSSASLLEGTEESTEEWASIVERDLRSAIEAGASLAADLVPGAITSVDVDLGAAVDELVDTIVVPLRGRLVRAIDEDVTATGESDEDTNDERELADRIRACYREWRGARLASAVSDVCARAFGLGVRAATPRELPLHWYCGPGDTPCPDCDDNRLAGAVAATEAFPTGQKVAPAHPGCRCLALPDLG